MLMINNLQAPHIQCWKYVDDTIITEIVQPESTSKIQNDVDTFKDWSDNNKL